MIEPRIATALDYAEEAIEAARAGTTKRWFFVSVAGEIIFETPQYLLLFGLAKHAPLDGRLDEAFMAPARDAPDAALEEWAGKPLLFTVASPVPKSPDIDDATSQAGSRLPWYVDAATTDRELAEAMVEVRGGGKIRGREEMLASPGTAAALRAWEAGDDRLIAPLVVAQAEYLKSKLPEARAHFTWQG